MIRQYTQTVDFRPVASVDRPVFRLDDAAYSLFYAPGCLCVVPSNQADAFAESIGPGAAGWAGRLWDAAQWATQVYDELVTVPYAPQCLTLYLHNDCNLACTYCYTDPSTQSRLRLDARAITRAADRVAANCARSGRDFHLVLHGGGEPSRYRGQVETVLEIVESAAEKHGIGVFRYIATNGVFSAEKARWLANRFDLIGLSCDGPPAIQNSQRPHTSQGRTAAIVERTAEVFHQEGQAFQVRVTVTPESIQYLPDIARYVCERLRPQTINVEPVYVGGRTGADDLPETQQAHDFVAGLLDSQDIARSYGTPLDFSGSRPGMIHGPYCNVLRQVLNLVPGGVATACFKATHSGQAQAQGVGVGFDDPKTGQFTIDQMAVESLRQTLTAIPPDCADCFNRYHCVKGCPDMCPLETPQSLRGTFRCEVQRTLTAIHLQNCASELIAQDEPGEEGIYGTTDV